MIASAIITSDYFGNAVSCTGEKDGIARVSVTGGTPLYTYSWNTLPAQNTMIANGLGEGTYEVVVTDVNGCKSIAEIRLTANSLPIINLPSEVYGCMGGTVILDSYSEPGSNCVWSFSNGQYYNQCGPFLAYFSNIECYDLELSVTNSKGCNSTISKEDFVCIKPNPIADFYSDNSTLTNMQSSTNFWNVSKGATLYKWDFGDGSSLSNDFNAEHTFQSLDNFNKQNFAITLNVTSEYGCKDSIVKYISIRPELIFYVPNAFTPDGDQFNNTFKPIFSSGYSVDKYSFLIFNRWGELIFEGHDIKDFWDGKYHGRKCQDGVYIWKIEVMESTSSFKQIKTGHVSLLKGGTDE